VLTLQNLEDSRPERFIHTREGAQTLGRSVAPGDPELQAERRDHRETITNFVFAQQQVASLEPSAPPLPKTDPSLAAWNATKNSESVNVLQAFVDMYPLSIYAEIAEAGIEELKRSSSRRRKRRWSERYSRP